MQVGEPKFLFPTSENDWPFSFFSFVHRTTSQGGEGVSVSLGSTSGPANDGCLLWLWKRGDEDRGERIPGEPTRDRNLRSNGLNEGVGLLKPGREAKEGKMLLPGEEATDPCARELCQQSSPDSDSRCISTHDIPERRGYRPGWRGESRSGCRL